MGEIAITLSTLGAFVIAITAEADEVLAVEGEGEGGWKGWGWGGGLPALRSVLPVLSVSASR